MDKVIFVQNVKKYCEVKGVKPTVACREAGVGTSFINNIEVRGQIPSVEKVQLLAEYLGVTTSELLGEEKAAAQGDGLTTEEWALVMAYRKATPDARNIVDLALKPYLSLPSASPGGKAAAV